MNRLMRAGRQSRLASIGPSDGIDDQAAIWAVESAHGDMTPESRADLESWLMADRRHHGAYMRACAWLRAVEDAVVKAHEAEVLIPEPALSTAPDGPAPAAAQPASHNDNERNKTGSQRSRRLSSAAPMRSQSLKHGLLRWSGRAAIGGGALAASLAVLLTLGVPLSGLFGGGPEADGAAQIVRLRDGSVARLSSDARIEVALSDGIRNITLLRGQATFEVARDKARPFVVRSGAVYAQATGTVYSVSRVGATGGTVKVLEGSVLVWPRDERDQAVRLLAGGTVTLDPGPLPLAAVPPVRRPLPDMAQISLDNVPIAQAVLRFNRVNSSKIVIADPAIGDVRIIGHYKSNDPEQFAQAAAIISGGYVEHANGSIVIRMKQ